MTQEDCASSFELLIGAYFGEDWDLFGANVRAVAEEFARREPRGEVVKARDAAVATLTFAESEDALEDELEARGLGYDPTSEGRTYREWLQTIVETLNHCLIDQPP